MINLGLFLRFFVNWAPDYLPSYPPDVISSLSDYWFYLPDKHRKT